MNEEQKARKREYYLKNKEEIAAKKREYNKTPEARERRRKRDNTPEKKALRRESDRKDYYKNRDKKLAQKKEHYDRTYQSTQRDWRVIVEKVKQELAAFNAKSIKPTLRTMHYRLFATKEVNYNNTRSDYTLLSRKTTIAREEPDGYFPELPIDCFADETRETTRYLSELSDWQPEHKIKDLVNQLDDLDDDYERYIPKWLDQPHYVEIWTEKKAMVETFKEITRGKEVDIVPFGGYHSVSYLWDNAQHLQEIQNLGKEIHILYFGDFDPTGENIEEVLEDKLSDYGVYGVDFQRIGVTLEQVNEFQLPQALDAETQAKLRRDARTPAFIDKYGKLYQIEIDALPALQPDEFRDMVIDNIDKYFDEEIEEKALQKYSSEQIRELVKKELRYRFDVDES
jgi:hypothetical protein